MRQSKARGADINRLAYRLAAGSIFIAAGLLAARAHAEDAPALQLGVSYTADVTGAVSGGLAKRGRVLDDLQVAADLDLDKAVGWKGATVHVLLLNNSGAAPNDDAGTLQGVDNIEVTRQRARLFEAWVEQGFGDKGSVRAGLYDLNSEFYANDSAGLLIAPAFGIGSELAATGPNGPSIFPSTALAVRARWTPSETLYAQAAVLNANAGVLGDPGGVHTSFDNGVLIIAEAGWQGRGKVAFGTWRYTDKQDDIRAVTPTGGPVHSTAKGAYVLLERQLSGGDEGRKTTAFARLGVSDGDTTAFKGGWQAGVLVERVFESRPDSAFSVGINQAFLSGKFRDNAFDAGQRLTRSESAIEVTYSDKIGPVTIQPDLQYVKDPGADGGVGHALVAILRFGVAF
ncbi:carbohydrate porin [Caulobacter sp. RL271]|jgi:porin|uniref:Carbohydrate porin n=1 Tax=Caulobacter segnis TaxID=88688 RepID=A0ABY4ZUB5_9CAUL|nr:carbohydrate porin [Caulobacter segnis]USQ96115.1 carbohydrate porin [Caulobacter segnis]